ncbi:MAG: sulfite exporter TauE/SafE family protein [Verrucomicrobiota bacterium]
MISGWEITGLAGSAVGAGMINAVAGGGTLLTFPTLLAFGTSPVMANATSTLALVIGTSGGMLGNRQHLKSVKPWLKRFVPASLLGGLIGSALLTHTSNQTFGKLVPFLILFATVLFLAQGLFRRFAGAHLEASHSTHLWGAIGFQFLVSIYGGYFGAGIGILMLATLGFVGMQNIYEMNTLKTILGSLINLVAAVWFIGAGLIDWPRADIMTVGAVAGYYLGSHYSQRISPARVRQLIAAIGFIISGVTFYKQFVH